jgi:hypothetical protein
MTTRTDATQARDDLRCLTADGYPLAWLADRIGVHRDSLSRTRSGKYGQVSAYTARLIHQQHHQLHGTNPTDHGTTRGGTSLALLTAGRNGWTTRKDTQQ